METEEETEGDWQWGFLFIQELSGLKEQGETRDPHTLSTDVAIFLGGMGVILGLGGVHPFPLRENSGFKGRAAKKKTRCIYPSDAK